MMPSTGSALSRVFAKSPFAALSHHIEAVNDGAGLLADFLGAAQAGDWKRAARLHETIVAAEHRADDLKDEIRLHLPRRLFLPVSRADLLELIEAQDKIVNKVKDISGLMLGRRMQFPADIETAIREYSDTAIAAVAESRHLLAEFDALLGTGFTRDGEDVISASAERLSQLEKQADRQAIHIRRTLLAIENDYAPLDVMFIYRVIDWIGTLADRADRVGTRLQILVTH
ncbi:MAG: TIGR00153 family protein [Xanthomonadales bacterium]|nr:TIGR00153 family protein [Xanthomonadales bacterium]|tara:strand:+ start:868 stop:1554 length:687 start_codon:yes stop_codon:yes gene_type:complete